MSLVHGLGLLTAHCEGFVVSAGEPDARAEFGERSLDIGHHTAHPLQLGVSESLRHESRTHLMICEDFSIVALGRFVQFDHIILDGSGLNLLGDTLLHVARRLSHLEKALVRLVIDGVGVNTRPRFRFRRKHLVDRWLTHRQLRGRLHRERNRRAPRPATR